MKYILRLLLVILFPISNAIAQDSLYGTHDSLIIKKGNYVISSIVTVNKYLKIEPGTKLYFNKNSMLIISGYFKAIGTSTERIHFTGNGETNCNGIVINEQSNDNILISYCDFTQLTLPIVFEYGWKRSSIEIQKNQFYNNSGNNSVIQIFNTAISFTMDSTKIPFLISKNLFSNNRAGIYFEDFASDKVSFVLTDNAFVNNTLYAFGSYNLSSNMIYGRLDNINGNNSFMKFEKNSFVNNFQFDILRDTLIAAANIGIYGSGKLFEIPNNYWMPNITQKKISGIYDKELLYNAPIVATERVLDTPTTDAPVHVYRITNKDDKVVNSYDTFGTDEQIVNLYTNKPIDLRKLNIQLTYFENKDSVNTCDRIVSFSLSQKSPLAYTIKFDTELLNTPPSFIELSGITGMDGSIIGKILIGSSFFKREYARRKWSSDSAFFQTIALNKNAKMENVIKNENLNINKTDDNNDSILLKKPLQGEIEIKDTTVKMVSSKFEFSLNTGCSLFYGSISNDNIFMNPVNKYNRVRLRYFSNKRIGLEFSIATSRLSNNDLYSSNYSHYNRGMNFVSPIASVGLGLNYSFFDNFKFSKISRIKPLISFGIEALKFSPKSLYNNEEFELQPLRTGGQGFDNITSLYKLLTFSFYIGYEMKYQFSKKYSIGILVDWHYCQSDFVDDVGPTGYPNMALFSSQYSINTLYNAATYFSNPSNKSVSPGEQRNDNSRHDQYFIFGISFCKRF